MAERRAIGGSSHASTAGRRAQECPPSQRKAPAQRAPGCSPLQTYSEEHPSSLAPALEMTRLIGVAEEAVEDGEAQDEKDPQADEPQSPNRHALAIAEQRDRLHSPVLCREAH